MLISVADAIRVLCRLLSFAERRSLCRTGGALGAAQGRTGRRGLLPAIRPRHTWTVFITARTWPVAAVLSRLICCGFCAHRQLNAESRPQWADRHGGSQRHLRKMQVPSGTEASSPLPSYHRFEYNFVRPVRAPCSCALFVWRGVVWCGGVGTKASNTKATKPISHNATRGTRAPLFPSTPNQVVMS